MTTTLSLGAVLGKGAYGMVYQGWLRQPGQQGAAVAVKVVEDLGGSNSSDQVRHEVRMMRAASHKCNVALLAEFVYREKAWLVLELCAAGSVADLVSPRRGGRTLDERQIAAVSAGAARGLAHLHDVCSVVHRDVKAANLLLTAGGEVKLADFGISRILEGSAIQGTVIGTPMWMAPELIMGSVETAGDLWSLGITMIEMAQGEPPLAAVKPHHAQLFKIVSSDPPKLAPPSEAAELHRSLYGTEPAATVGEWSPHFVALLTRCLQKAAQSGGPLPATGAVPEASATPPVGAVGAAARERGCGRAHAVRTPRTRPRRVPDVLGCGRALVRRRVPRRVAASPLRQGGGGEGGGVARRRGAAGRRAGRRGGRRGGRADAAAVAARGGRPPPWDAAGGLRRRVCLRVRGTSNV